MGETFLVRLYLYKLTSQDCKMLLKLLKVAFHVAVLAQPPPMFKLVRTAVPEGLTDMLNVVSNPSNSLQVSFHGCHCSRLSNQGFGGSVSFDGVDASCKKWFQQRKCNGLQGGSCYLNTVDNMGSLSTPGWGPAPETYAISFIGGAWSCALVAPGCLQDTCLIDLEYANQIANQIVNPFLPTTATQSTCPATNQGGAGPIGCQ